MSTIALPEQKEEILTRVHWSIYFKDGTNVHSDPATRWLDIATFQEIDGVSLSLTTHKVKELYLYPDSLYDERIILELPEPAPAFAFTRYSQALTDDSPSPTLLYSAFGYVLPDYCYLLTIHHATHDANRVHVLLPRPLTTTLW